MNNDRDNHAMEPVWTPCGHGCTCNSLTLICWGPITADTPEDERFGHRGPDRPDDSRNG